MTVTRPNLESLFGAAFRVGRDPAAKTGAERTDPWMTTLLCENGVIYPKATNRLAVECKKATATKLMELPGIIVHQQGDTEWTLLFDSAMFDAVAAVVKARSEAKRQAMAKHVFKSKKHAPAAPRSVERGIRAVRGGVRATELDLGWNYVADGVNQWQEGPGPHGPPCGNPSARLK